MHVLGWLQPTENFLSFASGTEPDEHDSQSRWIYQPGNENDHFI